MMPTQRFPDLENASVLITGGGSGIGAALTEGFLRQGARVAFIDIAEEESRQLCESLRESVHRAPLFLHADLRDISALRKAVAEAAEAHGTISVLVNNAARDDRHAIEDVTPEYWDNNQAINLRPLFFAAQAVIPGMKSLGGGSIINFTSISYMINEGGMPSYTTAKGGVVGLTKGLAGALGPYGSRVNAIAPGWVLTERQRKRWVTKEGLEAFIARQCLKRELEPADMVGPCLFLASNLSRAITAQVLIADGGVL